MTNDSFPLAANASMPTKPVGLWWRKFFIRLRSWEYWPVYVFNLPVLGIWIWNAIKSRDFFFFTLTNPGIETGGFFGESKSDIMAYIPDVCKPKTVLVKAQTTGEEVAALVQQNELSFPLIAKPEIGERGWLIAKVHNPFELETYRKNHSIDIILQTYVDFPLELSIMVYCMPDGSESKVTSVCEKHFLQIQGDGQSTIGELIMQQDRAVLQVEKLWEKFGHCWSAILPCGEKLILEHVGNHCRGTMFLNRNNEIDKLITLQMIPLLKSIPGVFYGRFDMRVGSWDSLRAGKDIRVLEFNGTSSDPAHIYQPGYSLWKAYRDISFHWGTMYRISRQNRGMGHVPVTFKKIISALILYFRYKRAN